MLKLTHSRAVVLMVAVTLMWSIAGVVTRHLEHAASFEVTFWRSFFTLLVLLVILPVLQGRAVFASMRHGGLALWISGVCWSVMFTAFMVALVLMPVANVLVTMSVGPLLTALFARVFIGHHIAPRTWAAIALAGLGIGWMYGSQMAGLPCWAPWWPCAYRWRGGELDGGAALAAPWPCGGSGAGGAGGGGDLGGGHPAAGVAVSGIF